jgi:catechol 2,3-dioxygenase-like lactoylglutathione lyase family enzyme
MVNTKRVEPVQGGGLPLAALNHISVVCRSLESSVHFYRNVLGFIPIRRPGSFDFDGAWLFNYGIGIHLLQAEDPESMPPKKTQIDPKDNHISFQVRLCICRRTKHHN